MKKYSRVTPAIRARLEEVVALKRLTPSYKDLEIETGIGRNYIARLIHDMLQRQREAQVAVESDE